MLTPEQISSQNDPNVSIHRWDFSSSLKIGQLYNACKDTAIDEFPWKSDIRDEVTATFFESECFFEGTNSNIVRLLNIDRDQQLSLQSEICPTTNVGRLLFEPRSSAFLIYKVSRKIEKLDVRSEGLRKGWVTPPNRHATYLVKEIEYGALAVLQLCFTDGTNGSDELQKKLRSIREHCESNSELPEIPDNMQLNFHCGTKFATNQLDAAISKMKSLKSLQNELHKSGVKLLEDSNALKRLGSLKTMIFVCGAWKTMSEQRETFASLIKNGTICAFIDLDLLKGMSGAPTKPEIYIYKEGTFFPSQD
ncbi:unnamed protein product, partial [Mesorhabditis belari]|uniref:Uncharacterized protein n=1 Tax=Mesorhabditis belari TaxID=2138241 RepID=A0AAF3ER79_9BILA